MPTVAETVQLTEEHWFHAEKEGRQAAYAGAKFYDNPYRNDYTAKVMWQLGFNCGREILFHMKRGREKLMRRYGEQT